MSEPWDYFGTFLGTTRRAYPILGPSQLRFLEVNIQPLKPVYLRVRILETGLGASPGASLGPVLEPVLEPVWDQSWSQSGTSLEN